MNKQKALFSVALIVAFVFTAVAAGHVSNVNAQVATQTPTAILNVPTQSPNAYGVLGSATVTSTPFAQLPVTGGQSAQQQQQEALATNIIGKYAYLPDGTQLGRIDSLIADGQTGQLAYMVVQLSNQAQSQMSGQSGATAGQGIKYFPVPWQLVSVLPQIQVQQLQNQSGTTLTPGAASTVTVQPSMPLATAGAMQSVTPSASSGAAVTPGAMQSSTMVPGQSNESDNMGVTTEQEKNESDLTAQQQANLLQTGSATPNPQAEGINNYLNSPQQFSAVVINSNQANFNNAPSFNVNQTNNWGQNWQQSVASYWSSQVASLPQTGAALTSQNLVAFKDISGIAVTDNANTQVGYVADMAINQISGQITYVIVQTSGGFMGLNSSQLAVPFNMVSLQTPANKLPEFQLKASAQQLNAAPAANTYSDLTSLSNNSAYQQKVDNYWNSLSGATTSATPGVSALGTVTPTP